MPEGIYDAARSALTDAASVRSLSGATSAGDISDGDLLVLIQRAQSFVINDISARVNDLLLYGKCNGSNVRFGIPPDAAARIIVDDTLSLTTDGSDCAVALRTPASGNDSWPTYAAATITSIDAARGIITLSAAPASTIDAVTFTGRLMSKSVEKTALKGLIELYAAHLVFLRMVEAGKSTLANPSPQNKPGGPSPPKSRWLDLYVMQVAPFKASKPRAAKTNTSIANRLDDGLRDADAEGRSLYGG